MPRCHRRNARVEDPARRKRSLHLRSERGNRNFQRAIAHPSTRCGHPQRRQLADARRCHRPYRFEQSCKHGFNGFPADATCGRCQGVLKNPVLAARAIRDPAPDSCPRRCRFQRTACARGLRCWQRRQFGCCWLVRLQVGVRLLGNIQVRGVCVSSPRCARGCRATSAMHRRAQRDRDQRVH